MKIFLTRNDVMKMICDRFDIRYGELLAEPISLLDTKNSVKWEGSNEEE